MSYLPLIDLKNGFWPVVHLLYRISEWNFTDMLNIKGYIFLVRTVTLTFPVHELSALDLSEKWFLTCSSFTIWSIWMKLHRYVDHQRLHIVTKDVISLSISVLLLFRHYISHKITFGAPSSGGVLRSACGAFIVWCHTTIMTDCDVNYPLCQLASQFSTNWVDEDLFWANVPNFNWNLLYFEYKTGNTKCCIANWWVNQYRWPCKKLWKHYETFFQVWAITSRL